MRVAGLLGLLLGVVALWAPAIRFALPAMLYDIDDLNLRIVGGCVIVLSLAAIWFSSDPDVG